MGVISDLNCTYVVSREKPGVHLPFLISRSPLCLSSAHLLLPERSGIGSLNLLELLGRPFFLMFTTPALVHFERLDPFRMLVVLRMAPVTRHIN